MKNESEKQQFAARLKAFAMTLTKKTTFNNEWTVKGFIDVFEHIYTISSDTKVISKVLELQLFPEFLAFAKCFKYKGSTDKFSRAILTHLFCPHCVGKSST